MAHGAWPKVTMVPIDPSTGTQWTRGFLASLRSAHTALTDTLQTGLEPGFPMWDEIAAMVWLQPAIVTRAETLYIDFDTNQTAGYGDTLSWHEAYRRAPYRSREDGGGDARTLQATSKALTVSTVTVRVSVMWMSARAVITSTAGCRFGGIGWRELEPSYWRSKSRDYALRVAPGIISSPARGWAGALTPAQTVSCCPNRRHFLCR
jgi:hypothetical protein